MILKALTLENFKGIREPVRVEFAPVTLLFGPNNAGKSTIVQALHYAREVFERNNTDAGRTQLGGDIVDLGGFDNLVYAHDRSRAIRMRFELDLSGKGLPEYSDWVRDWQLENRVSTGPRYLTLFSAFANECRQTRLPEIEESLRLILQKLSERNVNRLRLVMAPNFLFGQGAHDRFIRFGDYIWDLGLGLEIFEGPCSSGRCSATFKARMWEDDYREIEREIESHSKAVVRTIRP